MKNYNLKSIKLINFQCHENLILNFNEGITVISGLTSSGKSACFKALVWLYGYSNISEQDFRREGTDLTSVSITLQSGFEVERVRSNSLNRYTLKKEGCEDKIFDNVGRTVPDDIQQVLGIQELEFDKIKLNINFSEQDDLNFIFDSKIPGSFCAKLLNKLTGNELLDKLFQDCNKEKLNISSELKSLDEQLIKQKEDVENCTKEYEELNLKLQKVKEVYSKIEEKIIIYDELKRLASKLKENKEAEDFVKFKLEKIIIISEQTINELKSKSELLKELTSIQNRLKEVKINLDKTKEEQKLIKIPKIDLEELKQKAEMYSDLERIYDVLNQNKENQEKVTIQIKEKQVLLNDLNKQLKEIWSKLSFCEKCKPIAEKVIFGEKK